jgi:hypothetical protein
VEESRLECSFQQLARSGNEKNNSLARFCKTTPLSLTYLIDNIKKKIIELREDGFSDHINVCFMSIHETRPYLLCELELIVCLGLGNLRSRVSQYQFALMVLYHEKLDVSQSDIPRFDRLSIS